MQPTSTKFEELALQLASIEEKVSDLWMIISLLESFLKSYQTLVVTLEDERTKCFDDGDDN